jgi:hypothetical protein
LTGKPIEHTDKSVDLNDKSMKTKTSEERGSDLTRRVCDKVVDGATDPSAAACTSSGLVELRLDAAPLPRRHGSLPLQLSG